MDIPIVKIYELNDDDTFIKQKGESSTAMYWFRRDTGDLKARINGVVRTLFNASGQPGSPSPTVAQSSTFTRSSGQSSGNQAVLGLGFRPRIVHVIATEDGVPTAFSNGWSTGTTHSSSGVSADLANCVNVKRVADGWTATILMEDDGFTAVWTKVGQGLNVTVSYLAIK